MATDEEVRRLILEVVGEEKVRSLREQVDREKESLVQLTNTLSHLTAEQIASDKGVQTATLRMADLNQELRKLQTAHRNVGLAALEGSRALEDLQYGVAGVVNNIPGLVMALGGGAGLTAAISLVTVAINQLVKHKDDLLGFFSNRPIIEFSGALEGVKKTIDELAKKELKTVFDVQAIEGAKAIAEWMERAQKAAESFRGLRTEEEEAAGRAAREAIAAVPGGAGALQGRMVEAVTQQNLERSARLRMLQEEVRFQEAKIPGLPGGVMGRDFQQVVKPLIDAAKEGIAGIQVEARRQAERTVGEAFRGAVAGEAGGRERFAELARGVGAGPLAEMISRTTPEAMEQREIRKQQADLEKQQDRWRANLDKANQEAGAAEMRAINEKIRIEEREKVEKERQEERTERGEEQRRRKVEREEDARARQEAAFLERSFGERNRALAVQGLAQGMSPEAIRSQIAAASMRAGASRLGAERAAGEQMERVMVDINKNGGLAATLVNQQSKIMHQFQREQAEQRRILEDAWRRTNQIQDNAFRRGR